MDVLDSKQLDHHGLVAGIISDLNLPSLVDEKLPKDDQAKISNGQAIAAMIINCLGFTSKPLSLTPHFFESKALDILFDSKVEAKDFNRHRLGRCLDDVFDYGCDMLYAELASHICREEGISQTFNSLDSTSHTVTGAYDQDSDEHEVVITHGFSKDHRPDLKQVVQELLVSQDGGIPLISKSFPGNTSDNDIFKSRAAALLDQFKQSESPRYLVADSKLYAKANAVNLKELPFVTRIPRTIKAENETVAQAIAANQWESLDSSNRYTVCQCDHFGIQQRWLVIYSDAANARAQKQLDKDIKKEAQSLRLKLKHCRNEPFRCEHDAHAALDKLDQSLRYHALQKKTVTAKACYSTKGRPKKGEAPAYFIHTATATFQEDPKRQQLRIDEKSCYVLGTNIPSEQLSDVEVISAYKKQNESIERGFRFLKDPYFFASSFFIKKPERIMALLMIMTLALLVYSIAQRRLRKTLEANQETLPNQIGKATAKPTLRWVFQLLEGISVVYFKAKTKVRTTITGLTDLKRKIIGLFSEKIRKRYGLVKNQEIPEWGCSM